MKKLILPLAVQALAATAHQFGIELIGPPLHLRVAQPLPRFRANTHAMPPLKRPRPDLLLDAMEARAIADRLKEALTKVKGHPEERRHLPSLLLAIEVAEEHAAKCQLAARG